MASVHIQNARKTFGEATVYGEDFEPKAAQTATSCCAAKPESEPQRVTAGACC